RRAWRRSPRRRRAGARRDALGGRGIPRGRRRGAQARDDRAARSADGGRVGARRGGSMNRLLTVPMVVAIATVAAIAGFLHFEGREPTRDTEAIWATIDRYCMDCHNAVEVAGGLSFASVDRHAIAAEDRKSTRLNSSHVK